MKVLVVGRHAPELPDEYQVVGQENFMFALDSERVRPQILLLVKKAKDTGAEAVLFQNTPGQVTAALIALALEKWGDFDTPLGVIITVPGPREAGKQARYITPDPTALTDAVGFVNARAKIDLDRSCLYGDGYQVTVTVDPIARFEFSHVEWFWK